MKQTHQNQILEGIDRKPTKKLIALASGGVESTTSILLMKDRGYKIHGLFLDYGQPSMEAERKVVNKLWEQGHFSSLTIDISGDLTMSFINNWETDKDAWIPFRNTLFMIYAGRKAIKLDADGIIIGIGRQDIGVYGDNDITHHKLVETLLYHGSGRDIQVFTPTLSMSKQDMLSFLSKREVNTVSCWNAKVIDNKIVVCGQCAQCEERGDTNE